MYSWQINDLTMSQRLEVTSEEIDYNCDYFNIDPNSESKEDDDGINQSDISLFY